MLGQLWQGCEYHDTDIREIPPEYSVVCLQDPKNENESTTPFDWEGSPFTTSIYLTFYVNILYMGRVKPLSAIQHIYVTVEGTQTNPISALAMKGF